jgi:predicted transcriptional regulator of viral defense system
MKFNELIQIVGEEPVFETGFLLAGDVDPNLVRKQLSLWTRAGKLHQLRRGVYALAAPYQKSKPHPFLVANRLVRGSYVSCQSALAYYDMIPEYVPTIISVTTQRPGHWETDLGSFEFRHVKPELFYGYRVSDIGNGQTALVATPEKALLDLIYLHPGGDAPAYLHELRLQNLEQLDADTLQRYVDEAQSQKLRRAASGIIALASIEAEAYETL